VETNIHSSGAGEKAAYTDTAPGAPIFSCR
jgi:hypothetical protein